MPVSEDGSGSIYRRGTASFDGTGKFYLGREISQVMGHRAAVWLERPERIEEESPDRLVELLPFKPDSDIADIGAGSGYFSLRLARKVPQGQVYAVDIQQEMLTLLDANASRESVENIVPVLGTIEDPSLPAESVDLALMVDAYHEFSHPREMMLSLYRSMRPGGVVALVEYRAEDPDVPIKPLHKMSEAQVRKELEAAGFRWLQTVNDLPRQHLILFERPRNL